MIVCGIDPGSRITGIAVIEKKNNLFKLLYSNAIVLNPKEGISVRLKKIFDSVLKILKKYKVDEVAIETVFYGKNVQSLLKLGYARSVVLLASEILEVPISEYSPREIKKSIVGYGAASKQQIFFMLKKNFKFNLTSKHLDESDAIAIAFSHINLNRKKTPLMKDEKKYKSWKNFIEANPHKVKK